MAGAAPSAKPAPFLKPLDILDRGILLAESSLSVVIVAVMIVMGVIAAAGAAFQIQNPITEAGGEVLMNGTVWAAFLGASFATRGRKHLAIDAIGRLLPDRVRRIVVAFASTFGSVVAAALAFGVYQALVETGHGVDDQLANMTASGIEGARVDRTYQFHFMISAGFAMIAIRLLLHGFHEMLAAASGYTEAPAKAAAPKAAEEPDGMDTAEGAPRVAPVDQAGGTEIGIALAATLVPVVLALGSAIFIPVVTVAGLTALTLAVPLLLRMRGGKSAAATAPLDHTYATISNPVHAVIAVVGVGAALGIAYGFGISIESISIGLGIAIFAGLALMGAPLFTFLGGLALFLWLHGSDNVPATPLASAVEDVLGNHFARMTVLPTIPIFTLAGYLMSESNTPKRLVRVARALLGSLPGGLAVVCVLASAAFTVFSGASGITIVAIGGLLFPALVKDGYPEKFSLGLVTSGGALGITFFPCLPLLVYGIIAGLQEMPPGMDRVELDKMIYAGIMPGLLIIVLMIAYSMVMGVVSKVPKSGFNAKEAGAAMWEAKWELILPVVVILGLKYGGGAMGAASLTAAYVFIVEVFVYKDLSLTRDIPRIIPDSMVLVGAIFVKLCAATVLTFYFVQAQTAEVLFEALTCGDPAREYLAAHSDVMVDCREAVNALAARGESSGGLIDSPITFLIALNFFLLIVGMLMDIFSAIVVIVPLIMGIAIHFNIDPYHLGIVFLINLEIGYLMPPMGLNLFIASFRFGRPVPDLYPVVLPFIGIFVTSLLVTTYVPALTLSAIPGYEPHVAEHEVIPEDTENPQGNDTGSEAVEGDCDVPHEGEDFAAFEARCSGADTEAAPDNADCDVPRDNESFEDFDARCSAPAPEAAPEEGAAEGTEPTEGAEPAEGAPDTRGPGCDVPRADESFDQFEARCGA